MLLSHCLLQQSKNMKPTFLMLIHCLVGHLNMPLVQARPQALGKKSTNVTLTTGKHRGGTGSCRYSHQCHTITIYIQYRLFSWDEECILARKNREENSAFDKLLFRFSYGTAEIMETRGYLHVLAYWEHTKRLHYIQECCLVCKPGNHLLLAHTAAELERGRAALTMRDLWKCNCGNPVYYAYTKQARCTPLSSLPMALHYVRETLLTLKITITKSYTLLCFWKLPFWGRNLSWRIYGEIEGNFLVLSSCKRKLKAVIHKWEHSP